MLIVSLWAVAQRGEDALFSILRLSRGGVGAFVLGRLNLVAKHFFQPASVLSPGSELLTESCDVWKRRRPFENNSIAGVYRNCLGGGGGRALTKESRGLTGPVQGQVHAPLWGSAISFEFCKRVRDFSPKRAVPVAPKVSRNLSVGWLFDPISYALSVVDETNRRLGALQFDPVEHLEGGNQRQSKVTCSGRYAPLQAPRVACLSGPFVIPAASDGRGTDCCRIARLSRCLAVVTTNSSDNCSRAWIPRGVLRIERRIPSWDVLQWAAFRRFTTSAFPSPGQGPTRSGPQCDLDCEPSRAAGTDS